MRAQRLTITKKDFESFDNLPTLFQKNHCCPVAKAAHRFFDNPSVKAYNDHITFIVDGILIKYNLSIPFDYLKMVETAERMKKNHSYELLIGISLDTQHWRSRNV